MVCAEPNKLCQTERGFLSSVDAFRCTLKMQMNHALGRFTHVCVCAPNREVFLRLFDAFSTTRKVNPVTSRAQMFQFILVAFLAGNCFKILSTQECSLERIRITSGIC